ncbi:Hypothetical protein FKW44_010227, partial [Caligus rogercresseyi]
MEDGFLRIGLPGYRPPDGGGDCRGAPPTRATADEDDDEEAEAAAPGPSISAGIEATDTLLALADHGVLCMVKNYELLRIIR